MKPYIEEKLQKHGTSEWYFIRTFTDTIDEWFREDFSQRIQVFRGEDWIVEQSDNKTFVLQQGKQYTIPRKCFHRIKKGNDTLVLRVEFI